MKMKSIKEFSEKTQINAFGCLEADLDSALDRVLFSDPVMVAMSDMSNAQELMRMGETEEARQLINRAKYYLSTVLEERV